MNLAVKKKKTSRKKGISVWIAIKDRGVKTLFRLLYTPLVIENREAWDQKCLQKKTCCNSGCSF